MAEDNITKRLINRLAEITGFGVDPYKQIDKYSHTISRSTNKRSPFRGSSRLSQGAVTEEEFFLTNIAASGGDNLMQATSSIDFTSRRKILRDASTAPEIEEKLETICDEAIVYDSNQFFCDLKVGGNLTEDVSKKMHEEFKVMYTKFNFHHNNRAWKLLYKWLIEGICAFEVVYEWETSNDGVYPVKVIALKEIDVASLEPKLEEVIIDGDKTKKLVWIQKNVSNPYSDKGKGDRKLDDQQIIIINYNQLLDSEKNISYVERLMRSFNLMRVMETTGVGWHITNAQHQMKMIIPVGSKSTAKAKMALATVMNEHKEQIWISDEGKVQTNGDRKLTFSKQIILPSKQGQEPKIESIRKDGPNLASMEGAKYFQSKLNKVSKIPASRMETQGNGRLTLFGADGLNNDEIRFKNFITRLQTEFSKIITKPLYIQCVLSGIIDKEDEQARTNIGIEYNTNMLFEEAKRMETMKKRVSFINDMKNLQDDNRESFFSLEYLVKKYLSMNEEDLEENESMKAKESKD